MRFLKYFLVLAIFTVAVYFMSGHRTHYQVIGGKIFGTYYTIKIQSSGKNNALPKKIRQELEKINYEMSVFENDSEISDINRAPAGEWVTLSNDMQILLKKAYEIYKISNGAFDPTTGKLVDLWGFGTVKKAQKVPSPEEIKNVLTVTGFNKIKFSRDYTRLRKDNADITLNLSAIAKGYGVDRIAEFLRSQGYHDFVVEIGGEVAASGARSDKINGWNIGIASPEQNNEKNAFVVTLKDYAAATSGDYRNFFYIDNKKYSHTIDPNTGYPVNSNLVSVTVFHKSCMSADALATAIMAMGENKAAEMIERNNLAVIMFVKNDNDTLTPIISPAAEKLGVR